jgi:hypothetical protein
MLERRVKLCTEANWKETVLQEAHTSSWAIPSVISELATEETRRSGFRKVFVFIS